MKKQNRLLALDLYSTFDIVEFSTKIIKKVIARLLLKFVADSKR